MLGRLRQAIDRAIDWLDVAIGGPRPTVEPEPQRDAMTAALVRGTLGIGQHGIPVDTGERSVPVEGWETFDGWDDIVRQYESYRRDGESRADYLRRVREERSRIRTSAAQSYEFTIPPETYDIGPWVLDWWRRRDETTYNPPHGTQMDTAAGLRRLEEVAALHRDVRRAILEPPAPATGNWQDRTVRLLGLERQLGETDESLRKRATDFLAACTTCPACGVSGGCICLAA